LYLSLVILPAMATAQGTIEGTVTFWGNAGGGTQIEIAAHTDPFGPPDETVYVDLPSSSYSIPVADGTYYISTLMARDGDFGQPRPDDVLVWYDADGDGERDTVTVSGGAVTGIDIDVGFVYVDFDASGANDGSSWANAFTDLQDGIDLAVSGIEVWVAEGTYTPGASRSDSFVTKSGVRVYGGFAGGEIEKDERDAVNNPTILSGEIGGAAATDNCFHVVRAESSNTSAVLDALTITRGYANGGGNDSHGGGVRAVGGGVTLVDVRLHDNYAATYGGGIVALNPGNVRAINCRFTSNNGALHGGGFYISAQSGNPSMVVNCWFKGNTAWRGGGIAVEGQVFAPGLEPIFSTLSLSENHAGGQGGGIFTDTTTFSPPGGAPMVIENSILWGNTAGFDAQISRYGSSDMPVVNYSIVQGDWGTGTQILTGNPSFKSDGSLRLKIDSPAIDAGDSSALPLDVADVDEDHMTDEVIGFDLDFNWRPGDIPSVPDTGVADGEGGIVDMGAFEFTELIFEDGFDLNGLENWSTVVGGP
jgi:predicted outer membrane repeat protein